MPSAWFRPPVHNAVPPSLPGVLEGQFPRFSATMRRCDSLPFLSPHFVSSPWKSKGLFFRFFGDAGGLLLRTRSLTIWIPSIGLILRPLTASDRSGDSVL